MRKIIAGILITLLLLSGASSILEAEGSGIAIAAIQVPNKVKSMEIVNYVIQQGEKDLGELWYYRIALTTRRAQGGTILVLVRSAKDDAKAKELVLKVLRKFAPAPTV